MKKVPISLEFFPPKTPQGALNLAQTRQALYALEPEFCSVTFGAGGSTQDGTLQTVKAILAEGRAAAPHLSCIGASQESIRQRLDEYRAAGAQRIVALRGDMPSGYGLGGEFRYASDLVAFIRDYTGDVFHIEVAAYPETHPQAKNPQDDLNAYLHKVRAGANSAITQYFYNADAYFRFLEESEKMGAHIPVVPGIMPIINSTQLMRFSAACGAEIPRWIALRLQSFGDDSASIKSFGLDVVSCLCEQLIAGGAPALHIYSMNQATAATDLIKNLWQ